MTQSELGQSFRTPTRRAVLGVGGGVLASVWLASCAGERDDGLEPVGDTDAREAPQLAEMVENGELPPLEERLPDNPLVVDVVDRAGVYGGTWHNAMTTGDVGWVFQRTTGHYNLVRWDENYETLLPDLAEEWELSDDAREFVFKLRQGVKWSDGEPFTAEDIVFAVNDVRAHPEILGVTGEHAEAVDEYTVRFTFDEPNGLFLHVVAGPTAGFVAHPKHYLSQFHADYNDDIAAVVEDEGMDSWQDLMDRKMSTIENPDLPKVSAWILVEAAGAAGTALRLERNPYFWKVDPDGRQLPYIDEVEISIIDDEEVMLTAAANGEIDMQNRKINLPRNKPVLAEERESSDFEFYDTTLTFMNTTMISLNEDHEDGAKREVFQNKDFRIGLSHAINRQAIIDTVYQRQGEPWQGAPRSEHRLYDEEMAKQYTEYDVDLANQYLDDAGYAETDSNGVRLGPDGNPITFQLLVSNFNFEWSDVASMVIDDWREVGIDARMDSVDNTLFHERLRAREQDAAVWQGHGRDNDMYLDPRWYFPSHANTGSPFDLVLSQEWLESKRAEGEEPPAAVSEQIDLYGQILETGDQEQQEELMRQVLARAKEQFYAIGISLPGDGYGIVKNNFHNVPSKMIESYYWPDPGPTNPEQYFIQD